MANVIALAIGQYNGSFTVTGDIAATGYYSVGQDAKLVSFSGDVTSLGSFAAVVESGSMKYKLEPASSEAASDLMDAVIAIQALLEGRFATPAPEISGTTPFEETTEVSISGPAHADLYYTTDGTTPTSASTAYTEPFSLDATATVKAIAVIDGVASEVTSKTFTKTEAPAEGGDGEGGDS